nr:hypothetical protein [Kibdelosporangium sp. MJ126-NF4]
MNGRQNLPTRTGYPLAPPFRVQESRPCGSAVRRLRHHQDGEHPTRADEKSRRRVRLHLSRTVANEQMPAFSCAREQSSEYPVFPRG